MKTAARFHYQQRVKSKLNTVTVLSINYQSSQSCSEKDWVVLIHGLFGSLSNLSMVRKGLEASFNILSIDLPDHGESERSRAFSFDLYANSIIQQIENLKISSFSLLGHSLGGKVAMRMAALAPEKIDKLIVADISPASYSPRHDNVFNGLEAVDLINTRDRKHADEQLAQHIQMMSVRQFLLKSLYKDNDHWRWRFNLPLLTRDYPKLSEALPSDSIFEKPTLFIKGELSDYLTQAHSKQIQSMFPNTQLRVIGGTGHWLHAEKPQIFNRTVARFLQQT